MNYIFAANILFLSCCTNVFLLEAVVREVPNAGSLITLLQFLTTSFFAYLNVAISVPASSLAEAVVSSGSEQVGGQSVAPVSSLRRSRWTYVFAPAIPVIHYAKMVVLFFIVQVVNNMPFAYNVSMPLHMIFRSGSLMANLILGVIILRRRYPLFKHLSVVAITIGISICTIVSADQKQFNKGKRVPSISNQTTVDSEESLAAEYFRWLIGVGLLTAALFLSALMGIQQETTYSKFGKHPHESLFYNHLLPLPMFLFVWNDILSAYGAFSASEPLGTFGLGGVWELFPSVPGLWVIAAAIALTNYLCIQSVFVLTTECASLTVTLLVTLRKFVSLLLSLYYFSNPFTPLHALGTAFVFGGALIFSEVHIMLPKLWSVKPPEVKKKSD